MTDYEQMCYTRGRCSGGSALRALHVERKTRCTVIVTSTKTRDRDVDPFGAEFVCKVRNDGEFDAVQFDGMRVGAGPIDEAILEAVRAKPGLNQNILISTVAAQGYSKKSVSERLQAMGGTGQLRTEKGAHNASRYYIAENTAVAE